MGFAPQVKYSISEDFLTIMLRQKYMARGVKLSYRWRIIAQLSIGELLKEFEDRKCQNHIV